MESSNQPPLFTLQSDLPIDSSRLPVFNLDSFREKSYLTHNFHPYPAKFVPQIPRLIIQNLSREGATVLDPFCGSGTTLVEARLLGRLSFGSDSNPLSALISRAKTASLEAHHLGLIRRLQRTVGEALIELRTTGKSQQQITLPEFLNRDKWFQHHALQELILIKTMIEQTEEGVLRDFLLTCLSAITVKSSQQESETRWRAVSKNIVKGQVLQMFLEHLGSMLSRALEFGSLVSTKPAAQIYQANAQDLAFLEDATIDLIVTSPPYMNSFDYYLYHKLRLFLLGFDPKYVQSVEIGSRNKHSDDGHSEQDFNREMLKCLHEFHRVVVPGGKCCLVVGDSVLKGELIKMDEVYVRLLSESNFKLLDIFTYNQRKYSKAFTQNWQTVQKASYIILAEKI